MLSKYTVEVERTYRSTIKMVANNRQQVMRDAQKLAERSHDSLIEVHVRIVGAEKAKA